MYQKKVYFYSTHDSMIAVLMHSLDVFKNKIIPLSASQRYFVKLYYINETLNQKDPIY